MKGEGIGFGKAILFNEHVKPEEIICDGCVSCEHPRLIDTECPVRPCVVEKGFENCSFCDEYICEKLTQRIVNRAEIENNLKRKLNEEEYESIIKLLKKHEAKISEELIKQKIEQKNSQDSLPASGKAGADKQSP